MEDVACVLANSIVPCQRTTFPERFSAESSSELTKGCSSGFASIVNCVMQRSDINNDSNNSWVLLNESSLHPAKGLWGTK